MKYARAIKSKHMTVDIIVYERDLDNMYGQYWIVETELYYRLR
jgi:hypothetical protein